MHDRGKATARVPQEEVNRETPKWLAPESLAEIVAARLTTLTQFPRIAPRRPKYRLLSPWRESSHLPTDVRRIFAALFRELRLMNDMEQDSALPLRKPRPVDTTTRGPIPWIRSPEGMTRSAEDTQRLPTRTIRTMG